MSNVAQKIFEKNNFSVDVKTGLSEEEIIKIIPEYDAMVVRSATKVTKNIILAANNLKVQKIHPRVWMKKYGELQKDKLKRKRYLREIAKECFPDARVTLKTTDAILIAKYRFEFEEV